MYLLKTTLFTDQTISHGQRKAVSDVASVRDRCDIRKSFAKSPLTFPSWNSVRILNGIYCITRDVKGDLRIAILLFLVNYVTIVLTLTDIYS